MRRNKAPAAATAETKNQAVSEQEKALPAAPPAPQVTIDGSASQDFMTFGRCLMHKKASEFFPHQEYCLLDVPPLTSQDQLAKVLSIWGLEPPNLVIRMSGSLAPNPTALVVKESLKQEDLKDLLAEAKKVMEACKSPTSEKVAAASVGSAAEGHDPTQHIPDSVVVALGHRLFDRLVKITMALLDACAQTNSWLVLADREYMSGCFIEEALQRTTSRPVILVVEDHTHEHFHKADRPEQVDAWQMLADGAVHLSAEGTTEGCNVVRLPDLVATDTWKRVSKFSEESYAHAWPRGQWPFQCGSHYVLAQSAEAFMLSWLGPVGNVFVGGGRKQCNDIVKSVVSQGPTIILKHSGRASDVMSMILDLIMVEKLCEPAAIISRMEKLHPFWYDDYKHNLYSVGQLQDNIFSIVSSILDAHKEVGARLRSSVVIVNAWTDSPELVLRRLSACFGSVGMVSMELGSGAEEDVVIAALKKQVLLEQNCSSFAWTANLLTILGQILSFLSTFLAVFSTFVDLNAEEPWSAELQNSLFWVSESVLTVALPGVAGLLLSILSRMRYVSKWGAMHLAGKQIESETYKFRTKSCGYEVLQTVRVNETKRGKRGDKAPQPAQSTAMLQHKARETFVTRVSSIIGTIAMAEMSQDSLIQPTDLDLALQRKHEKSKKATRDASRNQARKYRPQASSEGHSREQMPLLAQEEGRASDHNDKIEPDDQYDKIEPDDFVCSLSAEAYASLRSWSPFNKWHRTLPDG